MDESGSDAIDFRLLGPVEVLRDRVSLPVGGPRQCALLALLLLEPGRPVAAERLVEELWHGSPPSGASTTLRAYVSKLRSVLGEEAPIRTAATGYAIDVGAGRIDARRFEQLAREGHEALERGASRRAASRLRGALELWRGHPFAGIANEGMLRLEAGRLEEVRLLALEERIEADLALGRHDELGDELETLVQENPYRERLWRQLMLALYRSGRQADALAAYRRAHTLLDEQLGLEPSEELKELEQAILRHEVPAVRPPAERHNLPAPLTSFVGRETELAEIEWLLGETRLVTLTGVGGVGKTRLALEAAGRAVARWADEAVFVDLAPLTDAALIERRVAEALGIREQPGRSLHEQLVDRLRESELLLVLDNCEHLLDGCAELAQRLLADCAPLRILATSRRILGLPGEADYAVPPLALPAADAGADELRSSEAVSLLLARARTARPRIGDDASVLASAGRICRDLDGLPLAIELAAARANALSLDDIANRLSDRFRFLVSWRRLTTARHRTLREALNWSYELLSDDEQALLARLSVFAGGFTLTAAARVCLDGDDAHAVELVGHLVDASLVVAEERAGEMRYRLLETVRQYGAERLEERGETEVVQRRHAEYFMALVEGAWDTQVANLDLWVARLGIDHDNLRAALAWSRDADEPEYLLRLAKAVWRFWWVRGDFGEGRAWLESALERGATLEPALRAEGLEGAAGLAWAQGDFDRAAELAEEGLSVFASLPDRRGELACATVLGHIALTREDFRAAERLYQRTRELADDVGEEFRPRLHVALALHNLGSVAAWEGELELAAERYQEALSLYRAEGDRYGVALSELFLGVVAVEAGRFADAAGYLGRALPVFREMGFRQYTAQCLEGIAAAAHASGTADEAARLLGAADALHERTGNRPAGVLARLREREIASTRAELGESAFAVAWAEGRALSEDDALDRALHAAG